MFLNKQTKNKEGCQDQQEQKQRGVLSFTRISSLRFGARGCRQEYVKIMHNSYCGVDDNDVAENNATSLELPLPINSSISPVSCSLRRKKDEEEQEEDVPVAQTKKKKMMINYPDRDCQQDKEIKHDRTISITMMGMMTKCGHGNVASFDPFELSDRYQDDDGAQEELLAAAPKEEPLVATALIGRIYDIHKFPTASSDTNPQGGERTRPGLRKQAHSSPNLLVRQTSTRNCGNKEQGEKNDKKIARWGIGKQGTISATMRSRRMNGMRRYASTASLYEKQNNSNNNKNNKHISIRPCQQKQHLFVVSSSSRSLLPCKKHLQDQNGHEKEQSKQPKASKDCHYNTMTSSAAEVLLQNQNNASTSNKSDDLSVPLSSSSTHSNSGATSTSTIRPRTRPRQLLKPDQIRRIQQGRPTLAEITSFSSFSSSRSSRLLSRKDQQHDDDDDDDEKCHHATATTRRQSDGDMSIYLED